MCIPMFSGAQNFTVRDGQFFDNSSSGPSGIDILLGASAPDATYDSSARAYAARCHPGTRDQYIEDIVQWAIPVIGDSPLPLLWMNGAAGVGKSAVAHSAAEKITESGLLGASFFFSTKVTDQPNTFFPSIAYQLSVTFDDYRDLVNKKILRDKTLLNKTMASQFRGLIVEPLVELNRQGKGIGKRIAIIVDGLDKCEGVDAQCEIIKVIAKSASEGTTSLCWAFFSRPEPHITAAFGRHNVARLCHQMILPVSSDANGDIKLYLRDSFSNLLLSRSIPITPPWPSDQDLKVIVEAADGLFVYATTVYRFIAQPEWFSLDEPLRAILAVITEVEEKRSLPGSTLPSPFAELDAFYLLVLRRTPSRIYPIVHLFLRVLTYAFVQRGAMAIANLLRLSKADFHALCAPLSAVINLHEESDLPPSEYSGNVCDRVFTWTWTCNDANTVSYPVFNSYVARQPGGHVKAYHKSFLDFLQDPNRSCEFCIQLWGFQLADHYWRLQLDYEESFCFRDSELVLAPGVPDSGASLSYPSENEFVNCLVKTRVYCEAKTEWRWIAQMGRPEQLIIANYRKEMYIEASLFPKSTVIGFGHYYRNGLLKYVDSTRLAMFRGPWSGTDEADETGFETLCTALKKAGYSAIACELEIGMIQPYLPQQDLFSQSTSLLHEIPGDKIELALYLVGRDSKAIFWFWEINYDKKYYREFRTANLEEGEKIYRAEQFDLWEKPEPDTKRHYRILD